MRKDTTLGSSETLWQLWSLRHRDKLFQDFSVAHAVFHRGAAAIKIAPLDFRC